MTSSKPKTNKIGRRERNYHANRRESSATVRHSRNAAINALDILKSAKATAPITKVADLHAATALLEKWKEEK